MLAIVCLSVCPSVCLRVRRVMFLSLGTVVLDMFVFQFRTDFALEHVCFEFVRCLLHCVMYLHVIKRDFHSLSCVTVDMIHFQIYSS